MKKLLAIIMLSVSLFTLSSCTKKDDTFKGASGTEGSGAIIESK